MSNIKACIFDLDGTLTNTINAIAHFGNIALAAFGLPEIPVEDQMCIRDSPTERVS